MTELSPVGTMTPLTNEVLGSCGILLPQTEAKILDITTGESLPTGESGELVVRGPQVRLLFNHYINISNFKTEHTFNKLTILL